MAALIRKKSRLTEDESLLANTRRIADLVADKKAKDIKAYDLRGLTIMADVFVICTATSEPQMKAVYNAVREGMREIGVAPLNTEGTYSGEWLLMDFGSVLFHIFRPESREFYDLDGLWGDAPRIPLELEE